MTRHIAILCIIAMVALSACSKTTPSAETATQENGVAQANAADAQAKEKAVTENCKPTTGKTIQSAEWTDATNTLALAVLKSQTGNAVASAYSAERALGMVLDGACGKTAEEMQNALAQPQRRRSRRRKSPTRHCRPHGRTIRRSRKRRQNDSKRHGRNRQPRLARKIV